MLLLPFESQAQINQEAPGMGGSPPAWGTPSADEEPDEDSPSMWSREPAWSNDEPNWDANDNPWQQDNWQRNGNGHEEAPITPNNGFEPDPGDPIPIDGGLGLLLAAGAGYAAHRLRSKEDDGEDAPLP